MSEQATQINISDVEILGSPEDVSLYGAPCIQFNLTVNNKTARLLEWVDDDFRVERVDSHLLINESDQLADLFEVKHDLIPFTQIFDELDSCLWKYA